MSVDAARHRGLTVPSGGDPLLTTARKSVVAAGSSATSSHAQYLSRLADFRQMDIQSALDQMKTLLSTRPHVVYKTAYYRKQTKNHWARDDPAFVALQLLFLIISCIAYAISFREPFTGGIAFLLYSVLFNWLGAGLIVASLGREIANRHLTDHKSNSHVRQSVEWLYAFDIHCNAFFPVFVLLCKSCCQGSMEKIQNTQTKNEWTPQLTPCTFQFPLLQRRSTILPFTSGFGEIPIFSHCQQYTLCGGIGVVLVHYAPWIPSVTIFVADRSVSVSHCGGSFGIRLELGGLSLWLGMECLSTGGARLF